MTKFNDNYFLTIKFILLFFTLLITFNAAAEIIDTIDVKKDKNGDEIAIIKFLVPIQKIRYFPAGKSRYLEVFFNILESVPTDQWTNYESRRSPSADYITGFTISTRDLKRGPKVQIQFDREVEYVVNSGRTGRSIVLRIKNTDNKTLKPTEPQPPALQMSGSVIPSKIGTNEGWPPFPEIVLPAPKQKDQPRQGELQDLNAIIQAANDQAAIQMAKGEEYLLAGQVFGAISAFNKVLSLPANKYTEDAQLWIGIAREKEGQLPKAILEYDNYLKLYPNTANSLWVKKRLAIIRPTQAASKQPAFARPVVDQKATAFQTAVYGSLSTFYFTGINQSNTESTVGGVPTSTSVTTRDQAAMFTNLMASMRSYNNEYDTRIVFQDMYAKNLLNPLLNRNRLNAAYGEIKNRISDYSIRVGRQSAYGGGVLGRFDGISAGYGITPDFRINVVGGQLSDFTMGEQPKFAGASMEFGAKSSVGGSLYFINQTAEGILDRQAVGALMRYFGQGKNAFAMIDYDNQFKKLNMFTMQGALTASEDVDFNFLVDHRRSPSLSIHNAVNGTNVSIPTLIEEGWTIEDLLSLADKRTPGTDNAQIGMTNRLNQKWQMGTDIGVSSTTELQESGTMNPDFTVGNEGFVPAQPASGNAWNISERLMGVNVITNNDTTMFLISLSTSPQVNGKQFMIHNHAMLQDKWTLDTTLRLYLQNIVTGGDSISISPVVRVAYKMNNKISLESELGLDWTRNRPDEFQTTTSIREYMAVGFRWDF